MTVPRLAGSLLGEGGANVVGSLAATAFSIATTVVVTRALPKGAYGEYAFATWLLFTLATLATLGVPTTLVRFLSAHSRPDGGPQSPPGRLLGGAIGLALAGLAAGAALSLLWAPARSWLAFVLPGAAGVVAISLARALLEARLDYRTGAVLAPVPPALALLATGLLLALRRSRPEHLVAGVAAAWGVAGVLTAVVAVRRTRPPRPALGLSLPRSVMPFLIAVSANCVVDLVVWQRSELFFLRMLSTAAQIAEYSVAYAVAGLASRSVLLFAAPLLPVFAACEGSLRDPNVRGLLAHSSLALVLTVGPACAILATNGAPLFGLVFGAQYRSAAPVLAVLLAGVALTSGNAPFSSYLFGTGRERFVLSWGLGLAAVNLVLDPILIAPLGAVGAALANSLAQLGSLAPVLIVCVEAVGWRRTLRHGCRAAAVLSLGVTVVVVPYLLLAPRLGLAAVLLQLAAFAAYLAALLRTGVVNLGPLLRPQAARGPVQPGVGRGE